MSSLGRITTIVPRLPPAVDGLGDYGLNLARQLRQDFGLTTEFVVGDANESSQGEVEGFAVKQVALRSRAALLELLPKESDHRPTVLLHYVGYGYAKRGCPIWLVEALEDWRKGGDRYLVTMFHELYAFGPIWTSQFWTSPLQRNLAARLVRLSDRCLTSTQGYAEIIAQLSQGKHRNIQVLPVFSNVGEPEKLSPLVERLPRLVVFGGRGPRSRVYLRSHLALERTCRDLEIEEILDIGPDVGFKIQALHGIPVTCLGIKPAEEISNLLYNSRVGFFDYHPEFLAKSTIFAAYCAHQLLPVGVGYEGKNMDDLEAGKQYLLGERHQEQMKLSAGQIIADNAYNWYQTHQLLVQARSFATCLTANE